MCNRVPPVRSLLCLDWRKGNSKSVNDYPYLGEEFCDTNPSSIDYASPRAPLGFTRFLDSRLAQPQAEELDAENSSQANIPAAALDGLGGVRLERLQDSFDFCGYMFPDIYFNDEKARCQNIHGVIAENSTPMALSIVEILGASSKAGAC